jgi:hypothetical protein
MGARHADCVCDSHQANGVAKINKFTVVEVAKTTVSCMACQESGVKIMFASLRRSLLVD